MPSARRKRMPGRRRCAASACRRSPRRRASPVVRRMSVAQRFEFQPRGESPAHERERLRAKRAVDEEIVGLVERSTVKAIREIFVTHREMLDDPELAEQVQLRLNRGESAEAAWSRVVEDSAAQQEALHDALPSVPPTSATSAGGCGQALRVEAPREPEQPYILVMDEVGPSDVARLDAQRVAGILTARGGHFAQRDHRPRPRHSGIGRRRRGGARPGAGHGTAAGWRARLAAGGAEHRTVAAGRRRARRPPAAPGPRRRAAPGACADPRRPRGGSLRQPWRHRRRRVRGGAPRASACCAPSSSS